MTEIDEISARLIVVETVVRQLITHMAVRDDDPVGWVQTRRTLATRAMEPVGPRQAALLYDAMGAFFDQAESVTSEYSTLSKPGTPRPVPR